jgi:hypothetical protein
MAYAIHVLEESYRLYCFYNFEEDKEAVEKAYQLGIKLSQSIKS